MSEISTAGQMAATRPAMISESVPLLPVEPVGLPSSRQLSQFWRLTRTLAAQEIKLRYWGSSLGYLWSLLRPLMLFTILYLVFTRIVRLGGDVPNYPVCLLSSIVLWSFFAETTIGGLGCLVDRANLMRKISFPRLAIPLSLSVTSAFHLALNLLVVLGFILISGITPTLSWLLALPLIAALIVFSVSVSVLLSTMYVKFRDLGPIWEVLSQILFWGSPIIYVIEFPPDSVRALIASNPIAAVLIQFRHSVIDSTAPSAAQALGGRVYLLIPITIVLLTAALAVYVFNKRAPSIAEEL